MSSSSSSSSAPAEAEAPPKSDLEAAASPGSDENSDSNDLMCEYQRAVWGYSEAEGADSRAAKTPASACEGA